MNKYLSAGLLGVITRLRNAFLASLRDSPKPRPDLRLVIQGSCFGIVSSHCEKHRRMRSDAAIS